jgi:hypothetical protein
VTLEAQPTPVAGETPVALKLQVLATEHWSLLASRSLAWNESFTRATMFLTTVSAAIVALALVAQATDFGQGFRLFALVILPVVLFVGLGTMARLRSSNYHDSICVLGMNRIRAAYLELAPDLRPYFVMSAHDDTDGMLKSMAIGPGRVTPVHILSAAPFLVSVLNSILFAAIVALFAIQLGLGNLASLGLAAVAFAAALGVHFEFGRRSMTNGLGDYQPLFPTPPRET